MPEQMQKALQSDAFLFGSLKANAQLFEASQLLLNEDGTIKPYKELAGEFDRLNVLYNQTYLESEYQFAINSSEMAAKWSELGSSNRYMLQYRTADDTRVRDTHKSLHNVTLPKEDPFWNSFYPPNGWRCRCTVVEVLKDKYEASESDKSIKAGEKATTEIGKDGKNRLEIFRFNPGKEQKLMPPKHPYNKVAGANNVKTDDAKIERKNKDLEIKNWAKENIPETGKFIKANNLKTKEIYFSRGAIKSIGDHFTNVELKEVAKHVLKNIKKCNYLESAPLDKSKPNYDKKIASGVTQYHYYEFEWNGKKFRLNTEDIGGKFEKPYAVNIIIKK
jgi:SPP1 gp7 family putative phage head morphogenesis protein